MTRTPAEKREAAGTLFDIGIGHLKAQDYKMGMILLGAAEKYWEEVDDLENAAKAHAALENALTEERDRVALVTRQVRAAVHASVFGLVVGFGDNSSFIVEKGGATFLINVTPST